MNSEPQFGTEPHKLHRRDSPATSKAAAHSVKSASLEKMVLETIREFGQRGCISDDIRALHASYPYSSITARFKALTDKELIIRGPDARPGISGKQQLVMRAATQCS